MCPSFSKFYNKKFWISNDRYLFFIVCKGRCWGSIKNSRGRKWKKHPLGKNCPKIHACSYRRNNSVSFNQYNLSIDCLLFSPTKLYSIILFRQEYRPGTTESGENFGTQVANWNVKISIYKDPNSNSLFLIETPNCMILF